ncbi:MAG: ribulose-phosphate 3-epimerase [Ruminococcaceae bacterium]|nr:ribulose-phosphate 3-epimerase [Oscillospiraceae bacterium]
MNKVAPSILSADFSVLGDEIKKVETAGADLIHIDVMDGHFVPNLTFGAPVVKCVRKATDLPFDVHLMIENPEKYIADFKNAGADIITVHAEACTDLQAVIEQIKALDVKVGVSINPATPVDVIEDVLADVDMVLVMSVNPGFGGQSYIHSVTPKIKQLKEFRAKSGLSFDIEVDGGIDAETAKEAAYAGADILVAGSAVYKAVDMAETIRKIKNA